MPFTLKEWQEHRLMHRYNTEKGLEMVGVAIQKYIENSIRWRAPLHATRDVIISNSIICEIFRHVILYVKYSTRNLFVGWSVDCSGDSSIILLN